MWEKARAPLLFFSLGFNAAFIILLGLFLLPGLELTIFGVDKSDRRDHHKKKKLSKFNRDREPGWWLYKQKLGISDTQWKQLRPDMENFHARALEICKRIGLLHNELLRLIERSNTNTKALKRTEERILELKKKKQRMFVEYMTRKKKYLDDEQEERFFGMLRDDPECQEHNRFLEKNGDR
jgi:hypothetical protein